MTKSTPISQLVLKSVSAYTHTEQNVSNKTETGALSHKVYNIFFFPFPLLSHLRLAGDHGYGEAPLHLHRGLQFDGLLLALRLKGRNADLGLCMRGKNENFCFVREIERVSCWRTTVELILLGHIICFLFQKKPFVRKSLAKKLFFKNAI